MKAQSLNKVLVYTLVAILLMGTYITFNSYYTQVAIYEEKELFKLDCIAKAVAFNISGGEHDSLVDRYPNSQLGEKALSDAHYQKIRMQLSMAKEMTGVPSEMYTVIKDSTTSKYLLAVATDRNSWLEEMDRIKPGLDTLYQKGGMMGRFAAADGERLGAVSTVMDKNGNVVGVLQVEETFESFLEKSKDQIYKNILISLFFVALIGTLMFFSVKSILKRQQKLAQEKAEVELMRRELVANVSHDLRTPLASIHGYIETILMKHDSLDAETRSKYLNTSLQSTAKLKQLVEELFELSKLESKERQLQVETFSIAEVAMDTAAHYKIEAQQKNITLETSIPSQLPMVRADLALTDRVLQNLIGNALKYCNAGNTVKVSVAQRENKIWVSVSDNGPGISAQDLPHIFDRFKRGRTEKQGTGLGLAIVKSALELQNEKYTVHSEEGKGTTFQFSLSIA